MYFRPSSQRGPTFKNVFQHFAAFELSAAGALRALEQREHTEAIVRLRLYQASES